MDDNLRNQYVEKIASKITEENIPFDEPSSDVMEYLQKFAITLGIDISHTDDDEFPRIFINGEITSSKGESVFSEGCLSIPKVALEVTRPEVILFKYQDIHEEWYEEEFDGLLARAIQHEIDHLNGVLIIDLVSEMQRLKVNKEIKKIKNDSIIKLKRQPISKGFVL